ncbi:unnamed protein product [Sphagnum balticum]
MFEYESACSELEIVMLQQHGPEHDSVIPELLQTAQVVTDGSDHKPGEGCGSCNHSRSEVRWKDICERIKVDANLEKPGQQQLWATLERYKDVFAWNKSELGYCTIGLRHTNVDALSRNPVRIAVEDEDFGEEVREITDAHPDAFQDGAELLCALAGEDTEWMGNRRKDRRCVQHRAYCFGINHQVNDHSHHLFMMEVHEEEEGSEESVPDEEVAPVLDAPVQENEEQVALKQRRPQYYDRRQQLELALAAQELSEFGDPDFSPTELDEEEGYGVKHTCADIWQNMECLRLIREDARRSRTFW